MESEAIPDALWRNAHVIAQERPPFEVLMQVSCRHVSALLCAPGFSERQCTSIIPFWTSCTLLIMADMVLIVAMQSGQAKDPRAQIVPNH